MKSTPSVDGMPMKEEWTPSQGEAMAKIKELEKAVEEAREVFKLLRDASAEAATSFHATEWLEKYGVKGEQE